MSDNTDKPQAGALRLRDDPQCRVDGLLWLRWKPDHLARHRPGKSRADQGYGYQIVRSVGRSIWYP